MAMQTISRAFEEAQRSAATHKSGVRIVAGALQKAGVGEQTALVESILRTCLDQCLVSAKKEASVDRVIKFFCEFLAFKEHANGDQIFRQGMEHLLARSMATDKTVRYRACQVIAGSITAMDGDAELDEELLDAMISTLSPRLRDKFPNVRMWAVKALARLQDPENPNCPLTKELMRLMSSDSAAAVRVAATDHILVTKAILPHLVSRVRDIKPEVRIAALEHIAKDVDVRHLSVDQRCTIVQYGLNDRDAACKRACDSLVLKWCALLDFNVPKLLSLLNLAINENVVELLAKAICEISANGATRGLAVSSNLRTAVNETCPAWGGGASALTPAEVLWAHLRCEYAFKHSSPGVAQEVAEALIPDTVVLCSLLRDAHAKVALRENGVLQLTVRYLLRVTGFLEQADKTGGQDLVAVSEKMLIDVHFPERLVDVVLDAWAIGLGRVTDESIIGSIIALSEKFNTEMAEDLANGVDEATLEILAATRGLQLVAWALRRGINGPDQNQTISATFCDFIIEAMQSTSPEMRCLAVQCMGLMSLSSIDMSDKYRGILFSVASTELEEEDIRMLAIKAIVDTATIHTTRFLDDAQLVNLLLRLMEGGAAQLRVLAAESAAKMLFAGTVTEARLFACLLKFFFLPDLAVAPDSHHHESSGNAAADASLKLTSDRLQQLLAVFFQSFFLAGKGRERIAWESISDIVSDIAMLVRSGDANSSALGSIMHHLLAMCENVAKLSAAKSSPDAEDALNTTVQEILDESETARVACRARLAASVSREILKFGSSKGDKAAANDFVKVLCALEPSLWASPAVARAMGKICRCMQKSCEFDKSGVAALAEFTAACDAVAAETEADADDGEEGEGEGEGSGGAVDAVKASEQEHMFFSFAPGLVDLVDCMLDSDSAHAAAEAPVLKAIKAKVAASTRREKAPAAPTAPKAAKAATTKVVPPAAPASSRPTRGAKSAAAKKIATTAEVRDEDEELSEQEAMDDFENAAPVNA